MEKLREIPLIGSDEEGWHCAGCQAYFNPVSGTCQCNGNEIVAQIKEKEKELKKLLGVSQN